MKLEIRNFKLPFVVLIIVAIFSGCTIAYKFNGASIDYTKTKTIAVAEFTNTSELVYAPLAQQFSEKLRDIYTRNTRLQVLKKGGDMQLEGEITEFYLTPMAISADTYASQTKLTVTINVRFKNNKNPQDDFEKKYSAYQAFDSSKLLNDVQDELLKTIMEEISDNIYNETVAKW